MSETTRPATSRTPRRRWWLLALILALVIAGAGFAWKRAKAADPAANLRFATVEQGDLEKTVTAVGSLKAKEYVDVGTQVSGRILKIQVAIGDRVAKGDLIAEIDPTVYASTVSKDRANLDNLKAQLAQRQAELVLANEQAARNERMAAAKAVSEDTVQQAQSAARVAAAAVQSVGAQIKAAQATLDGDLANLSYTKIYSPMDGTVVVQDTRQGQTVNSTQSVAVVAQIANLDVMTVWAQVAEADISRITPGMPAYFTTLGAPERRWQGSVRQVQPTPTTTNDVVLYNVLVDVDNRERALLPAMTVQAFFVLAKAKDAVLVPLGALKPDPASPPASGEKRKRRDKAGSAPKPDAADASEGEKRKRREKPDGTSAQQGTPYLVQVKTAQGLETRPVRVGLTTRTQAEVLSGLSVGEEIVVGEKSTAPVGKAGPATAAPRMPGGMGPRL
ncbi:MAG: efflux RND transporter periplasmic adaptor subunit [Stagnimonas sp.]|nr:efflux RND transporter periplasmic adaptor subunit [Stagnimonas sp.]